MENEMSTNERDLLIRLDEKVSMMLDQMNSYTSKTQALEHKVTKLEDRPQLKQPCVHFIEYKEAMGKEKLRSDTFKMWLIGLSISNVVALAIGIITVIL